MTDLPVNRIICGSAMEVLKTFPAESINCCISSPPYWSLRDYNLEPLVWDGDKNCEHEWSKEIITQKRTAGDKPGANSRVAVHRPDEVNRPDIKSNFCSKCGAWRGSLGLEPTFELYIKHLCDIYDEVFRVLRKDGTCWVDLGDTYNSQGTNMSRFWDGREKNFDKGKPMMTDKSLPDKCLCLIPYRFAIEMVNRDWTLRNILIWHKPNCMPSSADDRFTVDYEPVFFFVKSKKYWFEQQYEKYVLPMDRWGGIYTDGNVEGSKYLKEDTDPTQLTQRPRSMRPNENGRNMRCVWKIPTQPTSDAHFATFPEELVRPMIKAGCPKNGIVLDEFCGTATVCKVAIEEGRNYIGIDLNPKYVSEFALPKVKAVETGVSVAEQKQGMKGLFE
jgi:DNA modification methylase